MDAVVHFEIPSDDRERANLFYSTVFGWETGDMPYADDVYTFATTFWASGRICSYKVDRTIDKEVKYG